MVTLWDKQWVKIGKFLKMAMFFFPLTWLVVVFDKLSSYTFLFCTPLCTDNIFDHKKYKNRKGFKSIVAMYYSFTNCWLLVLLLKQQFQPVEISPLRGHLAMSRDISGCFSWGWGMVPLHLLSPGQHPAKHPRVYRTAPIATNRLVQMPINSPEVETPCGKCSHVICNPQDLIEWPFPAAVPTPSQTIFPTSVSLVFLLMICCFNRVTMHMASDSFKAKKNW